MPEGDAIAQPHIVITFTRAIAVIDVVRQAEGLIKNVRLGEAHIRIGLLRARLQTRPEILTRANERPIRENVGWIAGPVGDVKVPLLVGQVSTHAAVAVDAGLDVQAAVVDGVEHVAHGVDGALSQVD